MWSSTFGLGFNITTVDQGPFHTNLFSNVNGAVLLRIRLSSTLQRRKRSPKTEPFEIALQRGAIWTRAFWKRCFLVRTEKTILSENGDVINYRVPDHSTVSIQNGGQKVPCGFSLDWRCSVDGRKRYQNDKRGRKSFWKRSKTVPFSFENGLVWTALKREFSGEQTQFSFIVSLAESFTKNTKTVNIRHNSELF